MTFLLLKQNFLFGCVCQPKINDYDDDDDSVAIEIYSGIVRFPAIARLFCLSSA